MNPAALPDAGRKDSAPAGPSSPPSAARGALCLSLPVFFGLGSSEPREEEIARLLDTLRAAGGSPRARLIVVGETCDLGRTETNLRLAQARAERVAAALREDGYPLVATDWLPGGAAETDPGDRPLRRRAVIVVAGDLPP